MEVEVQSIDFRQANAVLNKIRRGLEEEEEVGWGPDSAQDTQHMTGTAGVGGASNVADIEDNLDKFMSDIATALEKKYDLSEDEAYDFIMYAADEAADMGSLPEFPDEDAPDEDYAIWYGKAAGSKFDAWVMEKAAKEL